MIAIPKNADGKQVNQTAKTKPGTQNDSPVIEVCVEGIDGLIAAQEAGADRIELCAALVEGGITPSVGTVREAMKVATVPFHVIVRPRGGDFLYSEAEFKTILDDIGTLRDLGIPGIVIGFLNGDGSVDEARTKACVDAARPMSVTFHRAFDMTLDLQDAVAALIRCGVDRVLTSGQEEHAIDGLKALATAVRLAGDDLIVMACGELTAETIGRVHRESGVGELHFAALQTIDSPMSHRNTRLGMGAPDFGREYRNTITDGGAVRAIIEAVRNG